MKHLILLIFIALSINSCNTDDDSTPSNPVDKLPPKTQTGENTFGYLVNGKPINVTNTSHQVAIYQGGVLQLGGGIDNSDTDINVIINTSKSINLDETYNLTNTPDNLAIFANNGKGCYYDYNNTISGSLYLTNFDQTNYIISGKFEFSTVTENCDTVHITNGRFDMQYIP